MNWIVKLKRLHKELLSINRRNIEYVYACNPRQYYPLADDKVLTKQWLEQLDIPVAKTYMIVESFADIRPAIRRLKSLEKAVIKPSRGRGGGGIMLVVNKDGNLFSPSGRPLTDQLIRQHLADIIFGNYSFGLSDRAIIEEFIIPHEVFRNIYPEGVPDVRVIVYYGIPVLSMVRIPTDRSGGKANLHQGAMGVAIDMDSGTMLKGLWNGKYVSKHPDTEKQIEGVKLPFWNEVLEISKKIGTRSPLKYLGIDIVLSKNRPVVMEINVRPGLEIQNINRKGLRGLLQRIKPKCE
ncbi:MAG: hypothetical protein GXO48_04485 [Chlorobi bacterium]|nr:hypothetical protein [Chlorobiota bacterium]